MQRHKQQIAITVLTAVVFVGAILLFGMEPLIGRLLTPYFGNTAHVWLTCLTFFQAMLLIGYLYAHLLIRKLRAWHLLVVLIPLVNLPLNVRANIDPYVPLRTILVTLGIHAALPFAALATTAVAAQVWLTSSSFGRGREPYSLYAASNAGSLIALLGYVFVVEPLWGVSAQRLAWSWLYIVYLLLLTSAWFVLKPQMKDSDVNKARADGENSSKPSVRVIVEWFLLSALPSAFLLAITNFITIEVGSFPFMWVLPLTLYLGSFIVTFRTHGGVPGSLNVIWIEVLLLAFLMYFLGSLNWIFLATLLVVFFAVCLLAHGNLYARRPAARHLTGFYLTLAFGGCIGGIVISLVAPFAFSSLFEYPILVILLTGLFFWCHHDDFFAFWRKAPLKERRLRISLLAVLLFLVGISGYRNLKDEVVFRHRNFYGAYRVSDAPAGNDVPGILRKLSHGRTLHGAQLLDKNLRGVPTLYFHSGGAVSDIFETASSPRNVAIIGLGCGVMAAYMRPTDSITYYEIDPDVEKIARRWFTFLDDCKGHVRIIHGDGRIQLEREANKQKRYHIIVIDAFSGDGIPAHLITKEAVETYLGRLAPNGVILFHMSNRYYDLRSVVKALAAELKLAAAFRLSVPSLPRKPYEYRALYAALTPQLDRIESLRTRGWIRFGDRDQIKETRVWTDDYINILTILKGAP